MERYEDKIEKALQVLKNPSHTDARGNAPIVYLVYQPEDVMQIKNIVDTFLRAKAEYYGFKTHLVSMGEMVDKYISNHDYRDIWTDPTVEENEMYNSIRQEIDADKYLDNEILKLQDSLSSEPNALLVLKDVEMLHPFYMMGVIENEIYNKITTPILVLYPGETQGTARSFLGVYNQDGNYRSINF
jgi:hypothetical protein